MVFVAFTEALPGPLPFGRTFNEAACRGLRLCSAAFLTGRVRSGALSAIRFTPAPCLRRPTIIPLRQT